MTHRLPPALTGHRWGQKSTEAQASDTDASPGFTRSHHVAFSSLSKLQPLHLPRTDDGSSLIIIIMP